MGQLMMQVISSKCSRTIGMLALFVGVLVASGQAAELQHKPSASVVKSGATMLNPEQGVVYWNAADPIALVNLGIGFGGGFSEFERTQRLDDGSVAVYYKQKYNDDDELKVTYTAENNGIQARYQIMSSDSSIAETDSPARLLLNYVGQEPLLRPHSIDRHRRDRSRVGLVYGPVTLMLKFDDEQGAGWSWIGGNKSRLQMNINDQGLGQLVGDGLVLHIQVEQGVDEMLDSVQKLKVRIADARAYLEGVTRWDFSGDSMDMQSLNAPLDRLEQAVEDFSQSLNGRLDAKALRERWQKMTDLKDRMAQLEERIQQFLHDHRDVLFEQSKAFNQTMRYRVGLGIVRDPSPRFEKWALFSLNGMRIRYSAFGNSREEQLKNLRSTLQEIARYGGMVNELAVVGPSSFTKPVDVVFTHEYIPELSNDHGINSAHRRDEWAQAINFWVKNTHDLNRIISYKIGNEPFWAHGSRLPVRGYGQAIVGCSPQTFQDHLEQSYDSVEDWRQAAIESRGKPREQLTKIFANWQSFDEMVIPQDSIRGLTFVDFLKQKYGDLDGLNAAWFGSASDGRAYASWDEVYPPRPIEGIESSFDTSLPHYDIESGDFEPSQNPLPTRPEDVPAWTDFARFWPLCLNNRLVELSRRGAEGVPSANVSTNCITGQYFNGFRGNGVITSLNPWLSAKDLPSLHIDFYSVGYLQGYMRSLAGAAEGRPFYISEAGGSKTRESSTYLTMYAFAYGAEGMTFWRRDGQMPPASAIGVSDAMRLLNDAKLQQQSQPITDGTALMFSLDSFYLANAIATDSLYLKDLQGGSQLMTRMQLLYDMYSDERLGQGVPDHIQIVFAPQAFAVNDQTLAALRSFVESGGVMVTTPNFGKHDELGWERDKSELAWLDSPGQGQVIQLPTGSLRNWYHGSADNRDDGHNPSAWAKSLPPEASKIEQVIQARTPRTVTYRGSGDSSSDLPAYAPGVRRAEDGTLYVFIDPWAGATELQVRGDFQKAVDLATGKTAELHDTSDGVRVEVPQGPTIVRFEPKTQP